MMKDGLIKACPFPPGEPKPDAVEAAPRPGTPLIKRLTSGRALALALTFFCLIAFYVGFYPVGSLPNTSLMYQPDFAVTLSMYTYASVMLTHFIRRYRNKLKSR